MLRTHTCGALRRSDIGREVRLAGWVRLLRDHGGVLFVDLADRFGTSQVVFDPGEVRDEAARRQLREAFQSLGREDVLVVSGKVRDRVEGTADPRNPTGEVEVLAFSAERLSRAKTPPFEVIEQKEHLLASEDIRFKHRYLDLRRRPLIRALEQRAKIIGRIRTFLEAEAFLEVETPTLVKSTPEGARDFLVPSRTQPGRFYALPQSPQLYKQLLMVGGLDRYYQIAKCFRDEDARADRQPEFTQLDLEMSFVDEEDIMGLIERLLQTLWQEFLGVRLDPPFERTAFDVVMKRYGTDSPDCRFELHIIELSDLAALSDYTVFTSVLARGGKVKCLNATGALTRDLDKPEDERRFGRKGLDRLIEWTKRQGAKGLTWMRVTDAGLDSNIVKYFSPELQRKIAERMAAKPGDLLLFIADHEPVALEVMGKLRLRLGEELGLIDPKAWKFLWVIDWPLFVPGAASDRPVAMRHPFTSPKYPTLDYLDGDPTTLRARAFDLVLNGVEIGSGSIRIHDPQVQARIFDLLRMGKHEAHERFGFLLEALSHGAPPHGGVALGLDRLVALMVGAESIKDVIAFPKNKKFQSLVDGSPGKVSEAQLRELQLLSLAARKEKEERR